MKKKLGLACILLVTANVAYGQVGINTPNPQSTLDITAKNAKGNTKAPEGLLIPRVDRQRAQSMDGVIPSTMIYVDDIATGSATGSAINIDATGFYFYEGNTWVKMKPESTAALYDADGALKSNRTVAHGTHKLAFTATETNAFSVDGNTFSVDAANNRVGIGTSTPAINLAIPAAEMTGNAVTPEGILIPRVTRLRAQSMQNIPLSTLLFVNSIDTGTQTGNAIHIDAPGYYYFDGNVWVKMLNQNDKEGNIYDEDGILSSNRTIDQTNKNLAFKATETNAFSVDGSTLSVDAKNDRIGVGTAAPTHKLHVAGSVKIADGTQGNNRVLTSDANGAATWKDLPADINTNLYTDNGILTANRTIAQTNKTLAFTGTATNAFSVDGTTLSVDAANDRIGVGTAAPTHKLHVAGSVKIADGTQANNRVLTSDANGAATWKDLPTDKNTNLYTDNGTLTANRTIAQTDKTLAFTGTATNAFSVDGNTFSVDAKNDRIGLGIATPMGKLDMVADNKTVSTDKEVFLRGYGTSKSPKIYISSANGTAAVPTNLAYNDDIGGLDFTPHAGNIFPWGNGSAISAKYKGNGTTRLTDLSLKTSGTERLKIDENGNIGVGTATPATKLDIMTGTKQYGLQHSDGTINLRTYLGKGVSNGQTDAAWIGTQSNHPLDLMTNDVVKVRIAANGNMGIGTSAPTHKLEVAGSVKIADGTQGNNKVLTSDANGAATWQDLPTDKNTNLYTDNGTLTANRTIAQADKTLAFTGTATNAFSVDGNTFSVDAKNDRIGLGIATPMGKLDMVADNKTVSTDKEVFLRGYGTSKSPILYISSANGTAAAPTNLVNNEDIGSISFTPRANNNFAWGSGTGIIAKYKGNGTTNLTDLSLKTSGTDRMKIDENGNVGIGTSTPDSKLHVAGKVKIADGTQGAGKVLTSDANGVATWQATSTSGKWVLDEIYEEVRTRPLTGYPSRNGVTDLDLTQRVYVTIPAYSKAKVNLYYNVPVTFQNSSNLAHYGYVGAKVKKENVDIPKSARRVIIPSIYSNSNPVVLFTSNSFVDEVTNNTATPMYIRYRAYGVVDITTVGSGGGIPVFYFGNQNNAGESIIKAEVYTKPL